MSAPLVLWVPKPPDNANTKMHHMVAVRQKNKYLNQLDYRASVGIIPPPPATPLLRSEVLIAWHYPDGRWHLDDDNAIRRLKPAFDWLVRRKYLAGDTSGHLRILPVVSRVREPTPPLSTVQLTFTPVPVPH